MAIQIPNPGTGNGATGDNEFVLWSKVKDNFSNPDHSASKLVGTGDNDISLNKNLYATTLARRAANAPSKLREAPYPAKDITFRADGVSEGRPPHSATIYYTLTTLQVGTDTVFQHLRSAGTNPYQWDRYAVPSVSTGASDSPWRPTGSNPAIYITTTATAPNLVVEEDGTLKRSSSSAKYKDVIAPLELDADIYGRAMSTKPIVYRSKAEGDPNNWHYLSFLAEELGELEPSLTQWRTHEDVVINEETGETERRPLEQKEAEGINLNAICAVLHATNIYQDKKIKELEQRLTALESANEPIE